jgi:replicative DNA helicase
LQILAPEDIRSTDKQNTDRAVVQLKNMSATHDIPVFCISSLNRMNYNEPISMAAFKESGAIEYGSDVLIGLQLYGIDRKKGEKDNDRAVRVADIMRRAEDDSLPADLEVKVLKNRNGSRGGSGRLLFDKKYNSFAEVPKDFTPVGEKTPFDTLPVI